MVNKNEKLINVNLSTIYPGSQIIHWAVYTSKSPTKWCLPPKSYYPQLTKRVDNALETEFYSTSENKERIISIKLPIKLNNKNVMVFILLFMIQLKIYGIIILEIIFK